MTITITINGKEIELYEQPKHLAVLQVQDIMTTWMMDKVEMSSIRPEIPMEDALKEILLSRPELTTEMASMQRTLQFDQTIMLATNMSYKELQNVTNNVTEVEYRELYEASRDAIGGTADYFFGYYNSGIPGTTMTVQVNPQPEP